MGKFDLMALPYAPEALEPVISKETIAFHHGKHLAGYVNNLNLLIEQEQSKASFNSAEREDGRTKFNGLLPGSGFEEATLEEIVLKAEGGMLNNAGQILNHNLYFEQFTGKPGHPGLKRR